jgi:hypothetical protein
MAGSIEQAILGVDMKMDKLFFHKEILPPPPVKSPSIIAHPFASVKVV